MSETGPVSVIESAMVKPEPFPIEGYKGKRTPESGTRMNEVRAAFEVSKIATDAESREQLRKSFQADPELKKYYRQYPSDASESGLGLQLYGLLCDGPGLVPFCRLIESRLKSNPELLDAIPTDRPKRRESVESFLSRVPQHETDDESSK